MMLGVRVVFCPLQLKKRQSLETLTIDNMTSSCILCGDNKMTGMVNCAVCVCK